MKKENSALEPGTPLQVQHFHVGQHVDIVQRSVDYGVTDIVTRFHKKSLGRLHYRSRKVGSLGGTGSTKTGNEGNWFNELSVSSNFFYTNTVELKLTDF